MTQQPKRKSGSISLLPLNMPAYYECLAAPLEWRMPVPNEEKFKTALLAPANPGDVLEAERCKTGRVSRFDPWEKRTEFLRLQEGDTQSLLAFLNTIGSWEGRARTIWDGESALPSLNEDLLGRESVSESKVWEVRQSIDDALKSLNKVSGGHFEFPCRLVTGKDGPKTLITTTSFMKAVQLTLSVDRALGAKVRKCERPDCATRFSNSGGRDRKYCCWYCGHIESVRRQRRDEKAVVDRRKNAKG